jgi:hypothetical protein
MRVIPIRMHAPIKATMIEPIMPPPAPNPQQTEYPATDEGSENS